MAIKNLLETYETTITVKFNLMERTALKIRHFVEAMEEEQIRFHEQTTQDLIIDTNLDGIESAKRNYNNTIIRHRGNRK
jgi:nitrate reductase alpha subunit